MRVVADGSVDGDEGRRPGCGKVDITVRGHMCVVRMGKESPKQRSWKRKYSKTTGLDCDCSDMG